MHLQMPDDEALNNPFYVQGHYDPSGPYAMSQGMPFTSSQNSACVRQSSSGHPGLAVEHPASASLLQTTEMYESNKSSNFASSLVRNAIKLLEMLGFMYLQ